MSDERAFRRDDRSKGYNPDDDPSDHTLDRTRANGNVVVGTGSSLQARSVSINGKIQAEGARSVVVRGNSTVDGSIQTVQGGAAAIEGSHWIIYSFRCCRPGFLVDIRRNSTCSCLLYAAMMCDEWESLGYGQGRNRTERATYWRRDRISIPRTRGTPKMTPQFSGC